MNRRRFLIAGAATSILGDIRCFLPAQTTDPGPATLSLDTSAARISLPKDFTGLSYESAQLANPGYFSSSNQRLVLLVRQLGSQGVLRIGGSTSDFDEWASNHISRGALWDQPVNPDDGLTATKQTKVSESAIDELRGFLNATGWKLIYGIDLGHGSPQKAEDEAAYVIKTIGPALIALQIGNEPDLFHGEVRKSNYTYADYFEEWQRFAQSILQRTPNAPLAGPDISDSIDWVDRFAKQAKGIRLLTSHYYEQGPPGSPSANIDNLLQSDAELEKGMQHLVRLASSLRLPYRMSEGNSCYDGGKPGVSDTFASALWGADFMLLLAQYGVSGVNFHGGGQGFYTPIAGGGTSPFHARPLYYGMLFYREFASGSLIPCKLQTHGVNATAYACLNSVGRLALGIINKDRNRDLHLELNGAAFSHPSREMALRAPSVESKNNVTLAGQSLSADGVWQGSFVPRPPSARLLVPRTSAVLIEFEGVRI